MLEPSKPRPSVKMSSLYSVSVVVKCCQAARQIGELEVHEFDLAVFDHFADVGSEFFLWPWIEFSGLMVGSSKKRECGIIHNEA